MSEITVEWIAMLLFAVLLVGVVIAEVFWLVSKESVKMGRAVAYVLITDILSLCIGSFVVFVIFGIMLMMAFGPAGRGSDAGESSYLAALIVAVIFPPVLLIASKRLFLLIFKIKSGSSAWTYSLTSSILIIVVALMPPPLIYYLIGYSSIWK